MAVKSRRVPALAIAACLAAAAGIAGSTTTAAAQPLAPTAGPACPAAGPGFMSCDAVLAPVRWTGSAWTASASGPARTAPPARSVVSGAAVGPFMAADLQSAYNLPSTWLGGRQTIAIVDAYDDPTAESDLAAYRAANHLPACDSDFPCFRKVNQLGQADQLPAPDANWAVEESLDLDMASAICPNCQIVLVEADQASLDDLAQAENTAVKLGANVISNSYGGSEFTGEDAYAAAFDHPGVAITVSSGDDGFQTGVAQVPAAFSTVTAVGGTTLYPAAGKRGWEEAAWGSVVLGAGSGCSPYVAKPSWQHDPLCPTRSVADVAAVADPATPVAIYDTYQTNGNWFAVGGTSVAAPIIAGVYALAGNEATIGTGAWYSYAHRSALFDVLPHPGLFDVNTGSNGVCGSGYLCQAAVGYDGPTGFGTPDGIGAF